MKRLYFMSLLAAVLLPTPVSAHTTTNTVEHIRLSPVVTTIQTSPGETVTYDIRLENPSNHPKTFTVSVNDFKSSSADGLPLPEPNPKYSLANWFTQANTSTTVTVPADNGIDFPAKFIAPATAAERSYFGMISFSENDTIASSSILYIDVGNPRAEVKVTAAAFVESSRFGSQFGELKISISNSGDGLFESKNMAIAVIDQDGKSVNTFADTGSASVRVLPESTRDVFIPATSKLSPGTYTVSVNTADQQSFSTEIVVPGEAEMPLISVAAAPEKRNRTPLFITLFGSIVLLVVVLLRKYQSRKA